MPHDALTQLRQERDRFVAFSFAGADLLIELDQKSVIRYAAGAARRLTGRDAAALLGRPFADIVEPGDRPLCTMALARLGTAGLRSDPVMIRLSGDGHAISAILSSCRLPHAANGYYLALSEARPGFGTPAPNARRDPASGLTAATDFERRAVDCVRVAKELGADLGLTFVELAGFDRFAEKAGAPVADALLSDIGGTLRAYSLGGDNAGQLDRGRFGVVHPASVSARSVTADVRSLTRRVDPGGTIGVYDATLALPASGMTAEDVANAISYAITRFATGGAAAFALASAEDSIKALVAETVARIANFKSTVAKEQFDIAYQPIVDLAQRRVQHHEALARFDGSRSPFETIRFAEGVALIGELDLAICRRVVDVLNEARKLGQRRTISINLSGRSISSDLFVATLQGMMRHHPAIRPDLILEITESSQIDDLVRVGNVVRALQQDGHRVCLDDFGAGSASFPYLQALNVDFVKIDGAYVKEAHTQRRDQAILKSMVSLCRELGVGTIAEMVETEDQAALLSELGVEFAQGWLFGRPGPLDADPAPGVARPAARAAKRRGTVERWE
jgi:EAL domain-containing protein (putative c-di-GMP-specific phosphodiesterase class I)